VPAVKCFPTAPSRGSRRSTRWSFHTLRFQWHIYETKNQFNREASDSRKTGEWCFLGRGLMFYRKRVGVAGRSATNLTFSSGNSSARKVSIDGGAFACMFHVTIRTRIRPLFCTLVRTADASSQEPTRGVFATEVVSTFGACSGRPATMSRTALKSSTEGPTTSLPFTICNLSIKRYASQNEEYCSGPDSSRRIYEG